jgi:2-methylisocitrate lyase-like PEP mutase family enzyme
MKLLVAVLLTKQPFFIGGIEDYSKARGAAYGAMWAYVVSFGIAVVLALRDARKQRREEAVRRATYDQVPALDIQEYDVNLQDLPSSVDEGIFTEGGFT